MQVTNKVVSFLLVFTLLTSMVFIKIQANQDINNTGIEEIYNDNFSKEAASEIIESLDEYEENYLGCPILYKNKVYAYRSTGSYLGVNETKPRWMGNKHQPGAPAACRTAPIRKF